MKSEAKVAVLLATYNGSKFIRKQLDSIINQSYQSWVIFASDDGSTDGTLAILREYQEQIGYERLIIIEGPKRGFAWNFISLLNGPEAGFDYYAFSDQDDEWLKNKLERSVALLNAQDNCKPLLYCGRTILIDEFDNCIGHSPLFSKPPSLKNALIQSIAGGNTMMLNNVTRKLVAQTPRWKEIVSHDWWIYIIVSGCDGTVIYDKNPSIKYRQHSDNLIGSNISWMARMKRIMGVLDGRFRSWNQKNLSLLAASKIELTPENAQIVNKFAQARNATLLKRVCLFSTIKIYRQTVFGTCALALAIVLKKL